MVRNYVGLIQTAFLQNIKLPRRKTLFSHRAYAQHLRHHPTFVSLWKTGFNGEEYHKIDRFWRKIMESCEEFYPLTILLLRKEGKAYNKVIATNFMVLL